MARWELPRRNLRRRLAASLCSAIAFGLCIGAPATARAAKSIPAPPYYYVLDEPKVLEKQATQSLQTLLIEHDRATGEQILIAIFKSLDGEDHVAFTNRVFSEWKIGRRGKDNGVLIALYWDDRKARIEVGYGLEALLTDAKSKRIIESDLIPELKRGDPSRALTLTAFQVLKTLESPLVQSGEAERILRGGGFTGKLKPRATRPQSSWVVWVFLGAILMIIVLNLLTSADAHFTRDGWYRPRPWRRRGWTTAAGGAWGGALGGWSSRSRGGWGSGGGFGGGGFGGFGGGGGSSGGGGASGQW